MTDTKETPNIPVKPKLRVFVGTQPDNKGKGPKWLDDLSENSQFLVVHPYFQWPSPIGIEFQKAVGQSPPQDNDAWKQMKDRDEWAIGLSDVLVYDLDSDPLIHFLSYASFLNIPVVGVSSSLRGISTPYLSSVVMCIIRPHYLEDAIPTVVKYHRHILSIPLAIEDLQANTISHSEPLNEASNLKETI